MIEHIGVDSFKFKGQTFYPVMVSKGGLSKMEHVSRFKDSLRAKDLDPYEGVMFYCDNGDRYGMVFLPGEHDDG